MLNFDSVCVIPNNEMLYYNICFISYDFVCFVFNSLNLQVLAFQKSWRSFSPITVCILAQWPLCKNTSHCARIHTVIGLNDRQLF